jgi:NAD(P)-dependent dehydrogenase (short-subunit alcohol dehydrogenase family)
MEAARTFSLAGKVVMVTGASGGLGERMAEVAAANGARVALVARRRDALEGVKARIGARGGTAEVFVADVTDSDAMSRAFDGSDAVLGPLDVFVANAGVGARSLPLDISPEIWDRAMRIDLDSVFFGAQEAARRMIAAGRRGSIITVASLAGIITTPALTPYSVAKAAVIHASKLLASNLGPQGIRVNCIAPGYIATPLTHEILARPSAEVLRQTLPLRRFGEPHDIDGPFLLLASEAGALMTGTTLVVDSGSALVAAGTP